MPTYRLLFPTMKSQAQAITYAAQASGVKVLNCPNCPKGMVAASDLPEVGLPWVLRPALGEGVVLEFDDDAAAANWVSPQGPGSAVSAGALCVDLPPECQHSASVAVITWGTLERPAAEPTNCPGCPKGVHANWVAAGELRTTSNIESAAQPRQAYVFCFDSVADRDRWLEAEREAYLAGATYQCVCAAPS